MRILVVHSGFVFSSGEIGLSLVAALKRQGHWVVEYETYKSLEMAKQWLQTRYLFTYKPMVESEILELTSGHITNECIYDEIDTVLFIHGVHIHPMHINALNKLNITTALWLLDDPHEFDLNKERSRYYKLIFTNDKNTVDKYERPSFYVPTAVDPEVFKVLDKPISDVSYYDILVYGSFYPERLSFLSKLIQLNKDKYSILGFGRTKNEINGLDWVNKPYLWKSVVPRINNCHIVLDIARDPFRSAYGATNNGEILPSNINPRIYEAAACGKLPITNCNIDTLSEAFGEDIAKAIHYDSVEEAHEKIDWFINHLPDYYAVVTDLNSKVLSEHTYDKRAEIITQKLKEFSPKPITRRIKVVESTRRQLTPIWDNNYEENKKRINKENTIKVFENQFNNKTGIIVSNGPSFKNFAYKQQERLSYKYLVEDGAIGISVNSAYKEMCKLNIDNLFEMIIDPKEDQAKHFKDCNTEKSILLASYLTSPKMLNEWKGNIKFFATSAANEKYKPYEGLPRLSPGLTVIYSAMQFLIYTGCKRIIFVGCDLAYTNGFEYYNVELEKDKISEKSEDYIVTLDLHDKMTITTPVMIETRNLIREEVENRKDVVFINASNDGIIHGENIVLKSLEKVLEE